MLLVDCPAYFLIFEEDVSGVFSSSYQAKSIFVTVSKNIYMYVCIYIYIFQKIYIFIYVYIYIYLYIYIYKYIYIYTDMTKY